MKKNTRNSKLLQKHARVLVESCATTRKGERILLIFDGSTRAIEPYLHKAAQGATPHVAVEYMAASIMHCIEPPENVVRAMAIADVILAVTKYSLAHTTARFQATKRGARYLSLPDYGVKQLSQPSLSVDFHAHAEMGKRLKRILDKGTRITIRTKKGTNLELAIQRRIANWAPGFCDKPGMLGSPPDIETNIAPVETKSNGVIIVDGSIPCESIGLLSEDIRIVVKDGKITTIGTTKQVSCSKMRDASVPCTSDSAQMRPLAAKIKRLFISIWSFANPPLRSMTCH